MEDKKKKPVPEKNTKKPTGKSATGKPLDGIEINPQLDDKRRTNEDFAVLTASLQERKALTIVQRQQRSRQLKRIQPKLKRAKEVSKQRLAGPAKLQARAEAKARAFLKSRFSSRKNVPYAELTTAEKIQVDTAVAKKTKLIKRLAARLLPKIRKAEYERLSSYHSGAPMKSLHSTVTSEDFSSLFNDLNDKSTLELVDIIENSITKFEQEGNPISITLRKMLNSTVGTDPITETLIKKSEKTGIPFSTLKEVFERGASLYSEETNQTLQQFAFNRVNSYIAKGRAWTLDADLREQKVINEKLDNAFNELLEKRGLWDNIHAKRKRIKAGSGERMRRPGEKGAPTAADFKAASESCEVVDRPPATPKAKKKQQEVQKKIIDESDSPAQREIGTKSLTKKYQKDTPGQENADLNETFNMAWTAGIGVTLSAEECGIKIKPGFEYHPSVEEEVRSADVKGVIVRNADGKTVVRKQKTNKKIIKSGNVHDGEPNDQV